MKKGFTLLELLIVIGILAILSTTMIIVINPAEMLKKARDSQRISDLSTVKSAIAMYLTDVSNPDLDGNTSTSTYTYDHPGTFAHSGFTFAYAIVSPGFILPTTCGGKSENTAIASQAVNGDGWIPVNFASTTGGSPIPAIPIDPNPVSDKRYYIYIPNDTSKTFELLANLESATYSSGGSNDAEGTDGGNISTVYEVGTQMIATTSTGCYGDTGM